MLSGDTSLENYLKTRDSHFDDLFEKISESNIPEIALAAKKVLHRNSYGVREIMTTTKDSDAKIARIQKVLSKFEGVHYEDTTIKAYNPNGKEMPIHIIDSRDSGKIYELSEVSINNIQNLSKRIFRAYIPEEHYQNAISRINISEKKYEYYAGLKLLPKNKEAKLTPYISTKNIGR